QHDNPAVGWWGRMPAVPPTGLFLIQYAYPSVRLIDLFRRRLRPVAVSGIEAAPPAIDDDERRVGEIFQQLHALPAIRFVRAAKDAEAFAVAASLAGEAADVHPCRHGRSGHRSRRGCRRRS